MRLKRTKRREDGPKLSRAQKLLIAAAALCFCVALFYPIQHYVLDKKNKDNMTELSALRSKAMREEGLITGEPTRPPESDGAPAPDAPAITEAPRQGQTAEPEETAAPEQAPGPVEYRVRIASGATAVPEADPGWDELLLMMEPLPMATPRPVAKATPTPMPSPTPNRRLARDVLPYDQLEKVELDESRILPELREIYELNHDLAGWLFIEGTDVDFPVVQSEDMEYYLNHDFYGAWNSNGQIILDTKCDPYTPSYNLIISGHHMRNGAMFGKLPLYSSESYWESHKFVEFDSLMERKQYVIFAAFYSADYDENEEGFRYNADIRYRVEAEQWLQEIEDNQIYDTGIDAEFGDEFITLTTCERTKRRNGRFVLVMRRIREGETIE